LFAAFNPADGRTPHYIAVTGRSSSRGSWPKVDSQVPDHLDVRLLCAEYSTHESPPNVTWPQANLRFTMFFTPSYSSWINQVETGSSPAPRTRTRSSGPNSRADPRIPQATPV